MDIISEASLKLQKEAMGLKTFYNDEIALSGGMRSGSSPAGHTRTRYIIYDMVEIRGGDQDAAECGSADLWETSEGIVGLVDIKILPKKRRGGFGRKTISALCDSYDKHFHISDIKKSAISFWASVGCVFFTGTKELTNSEARNLKGGVIVGIIPKNGCPDPLVDYAKLNRS